MCLCGILKCTKFMNYYNTIVGVHLQSLLKYLAIRVDTAIGFSTAPVSSVLQKKNSIVYFLLRP